MTEAPKIQWPEYNHPRNCTIHIQNSLDMAEKQEHVWAWLVRSTLWSSWYKNAADMNILNEAGPDLKSGSLFSWKTMGAKANCEIVEFIPHERIAWTGRALGIDVYHAWVLAPSTKGCNVQTEESQRGIVASLCKPFISGRLFQAHQLWLESLAAQARTGLPK